MFLSSEEPRAQGEDVWMHEETPPAGWQILAKNGQRELAVAVTSYFCADLVGADGKVFHTLLALALQHVFLYFL